VVDVAFPEDIKQMVAGSLGGSILALLGVVFFGQSITRPDPFTGAEGRALDERIHKIELKMNLMEYKLESHHQFIVDHADNITMFYGHRHRSDDGSVIVKERLR
jgi:hypothetical protein